MQFSKTTGSRQPPQQQVATFGAVAGNASVSSAHCKSKLLAFPSNSNSFCCILASFYLCLQPQTLERSIRMIELLQDWYVVLERLALQVRFWNVWQLQNLQPYKTFKQQNAMKIGSRQFHGGNSAKISEVTGCNRDTGWEGSGNGNLLGRMSVGVCCIQAGRPATIISNRRSRWSARWGCYAQRRLSYKHLPSESTRERCSVAF